MERRGQVHPCARERGSQAEKKGGDEGQQDREAEYAHIKVCRERAGELGLCRE
jgi:hypothetical protein